VDHHPEPFLYRPEAAAGEPAEKPALTLEQIAALAEMGELRAVSTGVVSEVKVRVGDRVEEGDLLLVLEAMKMLNRVNSPIAGTVKEVAVSTGQQVVQGDLLVKVSPRRSQDQ